MEFFKTSKAYYLTKSTYINLRWISIIGQFVTINSVKFIFNFEFNYLLANFIIFLGTISNLFLIYFYNNSQISNRSSFIFLLIDIIQLSFLLYLTGGVLNPFSVFLIIPSVFSSSNLDIRTNLTLIFITIISIVFLTLYFKNLPYPLNEMIIINDYYYFALPLALIVALLFLNYFAITFGRESRLRKEALDKIEEVIAKELQKEFGNNHKMKNDLNLLVSQSNRCREILKKLSLNPNIEDEFIDSNFSLNDYVNKIVRSYQEISNKEFVINLEHHKNPININKSTEIIYGLRNFIGNANKFSKKKIEIFLNSNKKATKITIRDDGPGFPKDLIDKHILGEPYIRTIDQGNISKYGLGLGTFIGKTLLEKNFANINFKNSPETGGAEIVIKWENGDLRKV